MYYPCYLLNHRLISQKIIDATEPNNILVRLNLSSAAGNITEATATKAKSDAISESLSNCFLLSFAILIF
ncbi:TPA: hypothetical protein DD690_02405 [Candidatus Daviesbacteria bacterium]|nr:MAG: hypothetical protein A3D02_02065 [Candidatus Daviesbacteria bacterium RIFCSPHIGHO2_02_FULL_39_41]HBQ50808.1 hypothetical protein [Candidatus Daviesbacteria bacterium]